MSVLRPLPTLLALVLGVAAALLVACGQDRSNLIPASEAEALKDRLAQVKSALDAGDCTQISELVQQAKDEAARLPPSVDRRLRQRINEGIRSLETKAPEQCAAAQTQTETIPTVTTQTDTTPTVTVTPTETTTTPADTTTTPADTTTTPAPTDTTTTPETPVDPGTGGAAPGDAAQPTP
jgi:hypothetical protein